MKKHIIIIVAVIVILLVFLAGSVDIIKGIDVSNANYSSSSGSSGSSSSSAVEYNMPAQIENTIINQINIRNIIATGDGGYQFDIDIQKQIDELYTKFQETEQGTRALSYLEGSEEDKKELLKKMVMAEIVTQYPDLRSVSNMGSELKEGEVQGVIKLKRKLSDASIKKVDYIKKSEDTSIELDGGVVCWGDNFTLGTETDNYPKKLAEKIKNDVYNLGYEGITSEEMALIAGANGYTLETSDEFTIGPDVNSEAIIDVEIRKGNSLKIGSTPFKSYDGSTEDKRIECSIGGVKGELTYNGDGKYTFKRTTEGEEKTVEIETEVKINTQSGYKNAFPIIWLGNQDTKQNSNTVKNNLVEDCRAILKTAQNPENYIIILPTHYIDNNGQIQKYDQATYNSIKNVFLNETEFIDTQILDLYDVGENDYNGIATKIKECLDDNNIDISGEYTQNAETNDVIKLGNAFGADAEITLEYIPLGNELQPKPGTLMWMKNHENNDIKKAALQYFSIDNSGNIVIAIYTTTTTTITNYTNSVQVGESDITTEVDINISKANYKNSTSQYTMPFDYLWTLLVYGEDAKFVENLADLSLNSTIEATLFDELSTRIHTKKEYYDIETKRDVYKYDDILMGMDKDGQLLTPVRDRIAEEYYYHVGSDITHYLCETVESTYTNSVRYRLTYADVWCLKYEVKDIVKENQTYPDENIPGQVVPPDAWTHISTEELGARNNYEYEKNNVDIEGNVRWREWRERCKTEQRKANQRTDVRIQKSGYTYSEGNTFVEEKTDKDYTTQEMQAGEFNEPNFVKYYLYSGTARNNISSLYSSMINSLESNPRTESMVDLTKYMFYMVSYDGGDKDITFDFDAFSENGFKEFSDFDGNGGYGGFSYTGVVNDDNMMQWQKYLEDQFDLISAKNNPFVLNSISNNAVNSGNSKSSSDWLNPPINNSTEYQYQCVWWAAGRASAYLNSPYPSYASGGKFGNGNQWWVRNQTNQWFNSGSQPKANSIACYSGGDYGHVAYVEAVDGDYVYLSHAGSGVKWYGITKHTIQGAASVVSRFDGYIYLDEPINFNGGL